MHIHQKSVHAMHTYVCRKDKRKRKKERLLTVEGETYAFSVAKPYLWTLKDKENRFNFPNARTASLLRLVLFFLLHPFSLPFPPPPPPFPPHWRTQTPSLRFICLPLACSCPIPSPSGSFSTSASSYPRLFRSPLSFPLGLLRVRPRLTPVHLNLT